MKCCSYKVGTIVEISDSIDEKYKFITIAKKPGDIYTYTRLVYSDETIILNHEYNEIGIDDLKIGDTILAFHSNMMTMSIPPQTSAFIIEVKKNCRVTYSFFIFYKGLFIFLYKYIRKI